MKKIFNELSIIFTAGAFGGICNGIVVFAFGALGVTAMLGVQIHPALSPHFIYQKMIWGGIWGALLLIPVLDNRVFLKGLLISLAPTLIQLCIVFPAKDKSYMFGLGLGTLTPLLVVFFNYVWGIAAVYWYKTCRE